ncbi:MAG: ABC transporter permease [Prevotellaceae bacterium]|jgi:ABC-2 type transport system permease protein|nr:ABC transporter permease [Prevotellaceae bacterium]
MKKVFLVIEREFSTRVKKKSFIITTILVPLLMAGLMVVPFLVQSYLKDTEKKTIVVTDRSGLAREALVDSEDLTFVFADGASPDSLRELFGESGWYAVVDVGVLGDNGTPSIEIYSFKQTNMDVQQRIEASMGKAVERSKMKAYNIEGLEEMLASIQTSLHVKTYLWGEDGQEKASYTFVYMGISYLFSFLIYIFIVLFGGMVIRGVIEEKTSRIVEVIVSSLKPFELMIGKILGVASVGLLQFVIWVALTAGIYAVAMGTLLSSADTSSLGAATGEAGAMATGLLPDIRSIVESIDFVSIIGAFILYFLFGYLLYAALYAAIGSAVESEADTQQLMLPVTIPLMIGIFIMLHTFQYPDSSLSFWCSMIPFTSPMVMMARIPFGVPFWEIALSLSLLLVTFLGVAWLAGKIYRTGILMYGKKVSFKEMWRIIIHYK